MPDTKAQTGSLAWMKNKDILVGIGIITVVAMLIIPLPAILLDFFMSVSIMLGLLILMIVMYVRKAYEFSIFPSLLLVATVFRLALNVSSTRLILSQGASFDGQIVRTFGSFVVAGSYVVGFIVFLILVAVQYIVITKGATRTSEVSARFTLDALPGKQMSIDSDLASGLINEDEARRRREEIRHEADFYGAMDGASKFVQGDVIVGIIITLVNIVGGLITGVAIRGESLSAAAETYTLLSIGDGLVSQIPSLLITTATGIIVTRAESDNNLGDQIASQMGAQPKALLITAGALAGSVLIPGFPKLPLLILAAGLGSLGYLLSKKEKDYESLEAKKQQENASRDHKPESVVSLIQVDPLEVEIGYNLIPLVDPEQGGNLLDRITNIRRRSALDMGLIVPPVRIRDNLELEPQTYSIHIKGVEVARGSLQVGKLMAMLTGSVEEQAKIDGDEFMEPVFGQRAIWIDADKQSMAEARGYNVIDCPSIIATHLTEVIRRHAAEILGRQEVKELIENLRNNYPAVVEELDSKMDKIGMGTIQKVLQNLLRERVSIRNMLTIIETIVNYADAGFGKADADVLSEYVRVALSRQITNDYIDGDGNLNIITVDPQIEAIIRNSVYTDPVEGKIASLSPEDNKAVMDALLSAYRRAAELGYQPPVFAVSPQIRSVLFAMLERELPQTPVVLAYNEIDSGVHVAVIASALIPAEV